MANGSDRREKLDSLRIDRDEDDEDTGGSRLLWWLGAAIVIFVAVAAAAFLLPSGQQQADSGSTATQETASASKGTGTEAPAAEDTMESELSASGYVTARRLATVSSEISGRVMEVLVEEGMVVEAGQVLARLDASIARLDLSIAEGNLRAARGAAAAASADNDEAQRALARVRSVREKQFASEADLTRAESLAGAAAARLQQTQGALASAEKAAERSRALLDKYEVRAPFAGVVTTKAAQPGEIVSPSAAGGGFTRTGICTIVDMNSLEVEVEVNESFISRVKPQQKATANLDAYPDWNIPAHVAAIIPTANRDKATVKVRVAFDALDPRILPEMGAKVTFLGDEKPAPAPAPAPAGTAPPPAAASPAPEAGSDKPAVQGGT